MVGASLTRAFLSMPGRYIGNTIFAILYGIQLCMFFMSAYFLLRSAKADKSRYIYIVYSASLLVLLTIAMACNLFFGQMMWIEHRNVDGGPVAFFVNNIAAWYNTFGTAADVTANVLGDGLMLYRCYVFWGGNIWVVAFPALLFLASTAMGIAGTIQSGLPGGDFFHGISISFVTPWLILTIVFNIITTSMIVLRLGLISRTMRKVLTRERAEVYTGVMAILVESALPFTLLGIVYLITYLKNEPEDLAFADIWGAFVALSPQAIILRVAMGSAWTKKTVTRYTTTTGSAVVFNSESQGTATALRSMRKETWVGSDNNSINALSSSSQKSHVNVEDDVV
ncbi:hypothetical protein R3P38DRAFT_2919226 [Favolaschia claudopus]|uniref:Uncharacterized protein n=1 Tax=Favolaschia claudopus TaxID=2862362 RepID=A0AAW0C2P3_9AGAR